jgi:hypothetical protein
VVSLDKTRASAPSRTEFETSDASVRVAFILETVDSSIYEMIITGFAAMLAFSTIHFWAINTFSEGISILNSVLAIITPSATAKISSKLFRPYWF